MDVEGVKHTLRRIACDLEDAADVLGADELEDADVKATTKNTLRDWSEG